MKLRLPPNLDQYTQEHRHMILMLYWNPEILERGLKIKKAWMHSMEYVFDPTTQEKADLIFQDKYNSCKPEENTTCFVVELKSDLGDHEIVGQLKKTVYRMHKKGISTGHWGKTVGIAIAKKFTKSGLELLWSEGFRAFTWSETTGSIEINEQIDPKIK